MMTTVGNLAATHKQREYIDSMRRDRRWDARTMDEVAVEITGRNVSDLTRREASVLIEHLRRTAKYREVKP